MGNLEENEGNKEITDFIENMNFNIFRTKNQ